MSHRMKNKKWLSILCLSLFLLSCTIADRGQLADGLTTTYALEHGFVESNPLLSGLSGPEILAVKLALVQGIKLTPKPICEPGLVAASTVGYGLALWNIGVMLGSGPASLPLTGALIYFSWSDWKLDAIATCNDPWHYYSIPFESYFNDKN